LGCQADYGSSAGNVKVTIPAVCISVTQWSINWGDGTIDTFAPPSGMTSDTHDYQAAGDYLIQAFATTASGAVYAGMLDNDMKAQLDSSFGSALSPLLCRIEIP
jgi:hypothetical protein